MPRPNPEAEISYSDKKRNTLTRNIAIVVSFITVFYYAMVFALQAPIQPILFVSMLSCSGIMLTLVYFKRYDAAKSIGLFIFLLIIYVGASSEDFATGLHLQFISASVVAISLYGFKRWPLALAFIMLAFILYLITYFYGFPWMEKRQFSDQLVRLLFIVNLTSGLIISCYAVFLLSKLNHKSEAELHKKETMVVAQNEELKKTNAELDRFVYSASHDLRAPLSSILGLVTLSEMSKDRAEVSSYLTLIRGRVSTLDNLIHDIIDYSRNSRQEVVREPVLLKDLVDSVIDGLRYSPESKEIKFTVLIKPDTYLNTDSKRLRIILNNLISNAIKYKDTRKDNPQVDVSYRMTGNHPELIVSDNGLGIESEHQGKIFNMFFRATEKASGSGLGLYIANETATKLGATISLESKVKQGSVFILRFIQENQ
jgi:signal transduction histidine kinase